MTLQRQLRFIPPILWMIVIFFLSSKSEIPSNKVYEVDFTIKKSLHVLEYFTLYLLWSFSFGKITARSFYYSLIFAFTDEIHQLFVPNRTGRLRDVMFDTLGVTLAYLFLSQIKYGRQLSFFTRKRH